MKKLGLAISFLLLLGSTHAQRIYNNSWLASAVDRQPAFYSNHSNGSHWADFSHHNIRNWAHPYYDYMFNGNIPFANGNMHYLGYNQSIKGYGWENRGGRFGYSKVFKVGELKIGAGLDAALTLINRGYMDTFSCFNLNYGTSIKFRDFRLLVGYMKYHDAMESDRYFCYNFIGNHQFEELKIQYGIEYFNNRGNFNAAIQYRSFKTGLEYSMVFGPFSQVTYGNIFTRLGWHGEKLCVNYSFTPNIFFRKGNPFIKHNITMGFYLNGNDKGVPLF
ncbi:MAG: hypothetical protein JXQ87_10250 [Bacteroidia bacterium]